MDYPVQTSDQLAQILRCQRIARRRTQQRTGVGVGLLPKTVSALETAPHRSTVKSLLKLLAALDLELVVRDRSDSETDNPPHRPPAPLAGITQPEDGPQ
jgi:HTH-type transcriptional regulator/antitoxin HipB